jgi:hypothetical protein
MLPYYLWFNTDSLSNIYGNLPSLLPVHFFPTSSVFTCIVISLSCPVPRRAGKRKVSSQYGEQPGLALVAFLRLSGPSGVAGACDKCELPLLI